MSYPLRRNTPAHLPSRTDASHSSMTAISPTNSSRDINRRYDEYEGSVRLARGRAATASNLQRSIWGQHLAPNGVALPTAHVAVTNTTASLQQSQISRLGYGGSTGTEAPSLMSGSSAPYFESRTPILPRGKPSAIDKHPSGAHTESVGSRDGRRSAMKTAPYGHPHDDSVLGIILPPALTSRSTSGAPIIMKGVRADTTDTRLLPPNNRSVPPGRISPQPAFPDAPLTSPSTRYSGSPSPFSHASTPTSMSSHSPGITVSPYAGVMLRQTSPTQGRSSPVRRDTGSFVPNLLTSRLAPHRVIPLRESCTSSSSGSIVKAVQSSGSRESRQESLPVTASLPLPSLRATGNKSTYALREEPTQERVGTGGSTAPLPTQTPPELAHLLYAGTSQNTSTPSRLQVSSRRPAPIRPSRDGAPNLGFARESSPVIQSGLLKLQTSFHKRHISSEASSASGSSPTSSGKSRFVMPSRTPARKPRLVDPTATKLSQSSEVTPVSVPTTSIQGQKSPDGATTSSVTVTNKLGSRFGFFSTRTKPDVTAVAGKSRKIFIRRGPMAGTGHEGYGFHAIRGRSGSTTSASGSLARFGSSGSTAGSNDRTSSSRKSSLSGKGAVVMDEFPYDRPTPTILRGEGSIFSNDNSSEFASNESSGGSIGQRPSLEARQERCKVTHHTRVGEGDESQLLFPCGKSNADRAVSPKYLQAISSQGHQKGSDGTFAARAPLPPALRTSRRSQTSADRSPARLTAALASSPVVPLSLLESNQFDEDPMPLAGESWLNVGDAAEAKEGNWPKPKVSQQPKLSRKPNFFQRTYRSLRNDSGTAEVSVIISPQAPPRSIAHYAMLESPEEIDFDDLERILQEARTANTEETASRSITPPPSLLPLENNEDVQSTSFSFPKTFFADATPPQRPRSPQVVLNQDSPILNETTKIEALPRSRPSRLAHVGRIPRVIAASERDQDRRLADGSFSRPFAPLQRRPAAQLPHPEALAKQHISLQPLPEPVIEGIAPVSMRPAAEQVNAAINSASPLAKTHWLAPVTGREFLAFPTRQNSELSYTSSSGISFAGVSTSTSNVAAPSTEDEIWDEYDGLIDEVLAPNTPATAVATGSSFGAAFQYASFASREKLLRLAKRKRASKNSRVAGADLGHSTVVTTFLRTEPSDPAATSNERESILMSAPHSARMSITDFYTGYGERNVSARGSVGDKPSVPASSRASTASVRHSLAVTAPASSSSTAPRAPVSREDDSLTKGKLWQSKLAGIEEDHGEAVEATTDLRFAALMTSQRLSFGRVLFSPAHLEFKDPTKMGENRILVLDGLGKDWSYYCALTYTNAHIYNLGGDSASVSSDPAPWPPTLPNHHFLPHSNLDVALPFPQAFFAAVVLRFPALAPESHYRQAVSECKRVLRPGGFFELSILDIDLVKMGNRGRKAVRELKTKIHAKDPALCLKNGSDVFMSLLGRQGFEGLQRCFVGMPVTGRIAMSSVIETTERRLESIHGKNRESKPVSVAINEGIAPMVSKVGRWWYSRCYEASILTKENFHKSIFADASLLDECQDRGTSFRLMLGHAQKPLVNKRRTASV